MGGLGGALRLARGSLTSVRCSVSTTHGSEGAVLFLGEVGGRTWTLLGEFSAAKSALGGSPSAPCAWEWAGDWSAMEDTDIAEGEARGRRG